MLGVGKNIIENIAKTVEFATAAVRKTAELSETTVTTIDNTVKILDKVAVETQKITEASGKLTTGALEQAQNITRASGEFTATNIDNAKKIFTAATDTTEVLAKGATINADTALKITNNILNTGDTLIDSTRKTLGHISNITDHLGKNGSNFVVTAGKFTDSLLKLSSTPINILNDYNDRSTEKNEAVNNAQKNNEIIKQIKENIKKDFLNNIKDTITIYIDLLKSINTSYYGSIKIIEDMGNCNRGLTRLYHFFTNQECNYKDYNNDIRDFNQIYRQNLNVIQKTNILETLTFQFRIETDKINIITKDKQFDAIAEELNTLYSNIMQNIIKKTEKIMEKQITNFTNHLNIINTFNNKINQIKEFEEINDKLDNIPISTINTENTEGPTPKGGKKRNTKQNRCKKTKKINKFKKRKTIRI